MTDWTPQQARIFENVASGHGHTVIQARAGCAKTTSIVEATRHLPPDSTALFLAFNVAIAEELEARIGTRADVHTCHSFGLRCVRPMLNGAAVDRQKLSKLVAPNSKFDRYELGRAVSLAKAAMVRSADGIEPILAEHGLGAADPSGFSEEAFRLMNASYDACRKSIDFDDMVWLPLEMDCEIPQYDFVFVDELQDLSPSQIELALRAVKPGGRIIAAGDDRQACYQFRGAGSDSVDYVKRRLNATTFPLTTTFRCASSIVDQARRWVLDIQAAPNAAVGIVCEVDYSRMLRDVRSGDFILSRTNAPLVTAALKLIALGRPATIAGRSDLGKSIVGLLEKQSAKARSIYDLQARLAAWGRRETARSEGALDGAADKISCAIELSKGATSPQDAVARAKKIFSDSKGKDVVRLSSTHRAKGLEADRVWILWGTYLRSRCLGGKLVSGGTKVEENLAYIATTRARLELNFVR